MGKASRRRKEKAELSPGSKKVLKDLIRESAPDVFAVDGKMICFNPLKKLLKGEKYKTSAGESVSKEMVTQYEKFLKMRYNHEKIAKANGVDIDKVEGVKDGNTGTVSEQGKN